MTQGLFTLDEISAMILAGDKLLLAGSAKLLAQLPAGDWMGGCTNIFVQYPESRLTTFDKLFVHQLPDFVTDVEIKEYDETNIKDIFNDGPENGFTVLVMPFASPVAVEYSLHATEYDNFAVNPVCGWLAAHSQETFLTERANTVSGRLPGILSEQGMAMHISLPENKYAEVHIFNPYRQDNGDSIMFDDNKIMVKDAIINGVKRNFAEYLREKNVPVLYPLVADYLGSMMNNVICYIGEDEVMMGAGVFINMEYRLGVLNEQLEEPSVLNKKNVYSMTCSINYSNPHICGKYMQKVNGPAVWGEIAYQQVGLTTVYVIIDDVPFNTKKI
jgi:hypothetical protein